MKPLGISLIVAAVAVYAVMVLSTVFSGPMFPPSQATDSINALERLQSRQTADLAVMFSVALFCVGVGALFTKRAT